MKTIPAPVYRVLTPQLAPALTRIKHNKNIERAITKPIRAVRIKRNANQANVGQSLWFEDESTPFSRSANNEWFSGKSIIWASNISDPMRETDATNKGNTRSVAA